MKINKLKTLALLLILPLFLTACSLQELPVIGKFFGGLSENKTINLSMWGLWEKEAVYQPSISLYKEDYPNFNLNYEDMSVLKLDGLIEYKKRVYSRLEQDSWDTDIVMVHNSWVSRLADAGYLDTMPETIMSLSEYSNKFYPVAAENSVINGNIYAVPAYYDGLVLVYNRDHFEEVGQTNAPTAWEEFRRLAIDLTKISKDEGNIVRAGAAVGSADNIDHFSDILGLMWAQAGVEIPQEIDSEVAEDALDFYTGLLTEHKVWREDFPEATTAFINGQVSMIFVPSWKILDILEANPAINIGVAPPPQVFSDNPTNWATYWSYIVPNNSDNKEEAWKFINFLSQEDSQLLNHREALKIRPFGTVFSLTSLQNELSADPYLGPVLKTAPVATSSEIASRSGNRLQVETLTKAVKLILAGEIETDEALTQVKKVLYPTKVQ